MPLYEYTCEANKLTFEVVHNRDHIISNWGELCQILNKPLENIDPSTPVSKNFTSKLAVIGGADPVASCNAERASMGMGPCCGGGCKK